jgi:hypothetical protein
VLAGKPWTLARAALGSFEGWDTLVSGCLSWLGFSDPVSTTEQVVATDPEREENLQLLAAW